MEPVMYKGQVFHWNLLSKEQYRYLYYDEKLTDPTMAEMFGVTIYAVKKRRELFKLSRKNQRIETEQKIRELMRDESI